MTFLESSASTATSATFFSYDRISAISKIPPDSELIRILNRLVQIGLLEQFVRVENNFSGIGDFSSITEIPDEIYDWRADMYVPITPDKLRLYYKLPPRAIHGS